MNYGLYLSASGVLTNLYRQDVEANNLANARTPGFKVDVPGIQQRDPETLEAGLGMDLRHDLLDRLGGGVFAGPQRTKFTQGHLEKTDNPMDVALTKADEFFAVSATDPQTQQRGVHLTRDGRFSRNALGFLVTVTGGHQVLDSGDQPIQLEAGAVQIDPGGRVRQNGEEIAQLQVARLADTSVLQKRGQNLFKINGGDQGRQVVEDPTVKPGFIEASGTNPIKALMKLIDATKAATGNATLIRYHDLLMDQAVNVLGRVQA